MANANHWKNWAENVESRPKNIFFPSSESELQQIIHQAAQQQQKIRVMGSGHSFTALGETDSVMVFLNKLVGLERVDKEKKQATVWAGTTINQLGKLLAPHRLAMANMGDIDVQSIAGATSTGTHGTGINFGGISTQIVSFRLLTANGEILTCNAEENAHIFAAGRVSLGCLGIITQITLQLVDAFKLKYVAEKADFETTLANLETYKQNNRNFEFYWFPHTDTVQLKFNNETSEPIKDNAVSRYINQNIMENTVFSLICGAGKMFKNSYKRISKIIAWGVSKEERINQSWAIFASPRKVKFREMEYNIPAEHFPAVIREVKAYLERENMPIFFPLECRWAQADDIWLSPAFGRDSAYIAFHVYKGIDCEPYFRAMEAICNRYEGRPHWGKMHTRRAADLEKLYPKWADFQQIRQMLDPQGLFLNPYLEQIMGQKTTATV